MLMTYTADFTTRRVAGDMFQSMNGDVWIVSECHGVYVSRKGQLLYRCTVDRLYECIGVLAFIEV